MCVHIAAENNSMTHKTLLQLSSIGEEEEEEEQKYFILNLRDRSSKESTKAVRRIRD